jgi:hypothetical protein
MVGIVITNPLFKRIDLSDDLLPAKNQPRGIVEGVDRKCRFGVIEVTRFGFAGWPQDVEIQPSQSSGIETPNPPERLTNHHLLHPHPNCRPQDRTLGDREEPLVEPGWDRTSLETTAQEMMKCHHLTADGEPHCPHVPDLSFAARLPEHANRRPCAPSRATPLASSVPNIP